MPIDSQVVNGRIIGPNGAELTSLEIDAGKIFSVNADTEPWREVDASGFYVLPGAVQPGNPDADHALALIDQGISTAIVRVATSDVSELEKTIERFDQASVLDFTVCWVLPADATADDIRHARDCGVSIFDVTDKHTPNGLRDALTNATVRVPADSSRLYDWLSDKSDSRFVLTTASPETLPSALQAKETGGTHAFIEVSTMALAGDDGSLWDAVSDGIVDIVASADSDVPFLQFLYREGVEQRGLSMRRLTELSASGPAMAYGLTPKKGRLEVGADADFVVFDPAQTTEINGASVLGRVVYAQLRGDILLFNNELHLSSGDGKQLTVNTL